MKKDLRKKFSIMRNSLSKIDREFKSNIIKEKLKKNIEDYEVILIYINTKSEVETYSMVNYLINNNKKVYSPIICENKMNFARVYSCEDLKIGKFGIYESTSKEYYNGEKAIVIVPGLVFSKEKYRIGYGGGFYDKFISQNPQNYYVGICFEEQIVNTFEKENFDQKVDLVITDKNIIK